MMDVFSSTVTTAVIVRCAYETMTLSSTMKLLTCALLTSFCGHFYTSAQSSSPGTSINGTSFPSLIDVTTEDLIGGLQSGLFTSVDLVNVSHEHSLGEFLAKLP